MIKNNDDNNDVNDIKYLEQKIPTLNVSKEMEKFISAFNNFKKNLLTEYHNNSKLSLEQQFNIYKGDGFALNILLKQINYNRFFLRG